MAAAKQPNNTPVEELLRRRRIYLDNGKNVRKAADIIGIGRTTLRSSLGRLAQMEADGKLPTESEIVFPDFPEEHEDIEKTIDYLASSFEKRQASYSAHTWYGVKVTGNKPIGILWIGDPHLDDNGCNWPTLKQHIEICKQPGIYGANIGDTTNNWAGRLVRLYANQDTSVKTARRLADWFMLKAGIRWLVFLLGNHDQWGDGAEILAQMAKRYGTQKLVCHDWEARFRLVFPNGWEPRIYAAHDFPGSSQWNPLHGPMKEGQLGQAADLYVCGHKHNWATFTFENPGKGSIQSFIRVRGYKFLDDHARHLGKHEQETGCSILTIFDPRDQSIVSFENVAKGADYLAKLRS